MITDKDKLKLNTSGKNLASDMVKFYGKITFNFQNGTYVNCNIEESVRPDKDKG